MGLHSLASGVASTDDGEGLWVGFWGHGVADFGESGGEEEKEEGVSGHKVSTVGGSVGSTVAIELQLVGLGGG